MTTDETLEFFSEIDELNHRVLLPLMTDNPRDYLKGVSSAFDFLDSLQETSEILSMPLSGTYHSVAHALGVSSVAHHLAVQGRRNRKHVDDEDLLALTVAGLFHDADHTRRFNVEDSFNLERAVNRLRLFVSERWNEGKSLLPLMEKLILSTNSGSTSRNRDQLESWLYDADTLAGSVAYLIDNGVEKYLNSLRVEGFSSPVEPSSFIEKRGLATKEGNYYWLLAEIMLTS